MPQPQSVALSTPQVINSASRFVVSFAQADHHVIEVELWLRCQGTSVLELVFPVWTPGSYMIREYARHVESIVATAHEESGAAGVGMDSPQRNLAIDHLDKHRWLIHCEDCQWVCVRYQLYAREMSVRTNWVEHDYAFLTGAAAFPMVRGRESRPIVVRLQLPSQWTCVSSSMVRKSGADPQVVELWADNYDDLVDSPIVCGQLDVTPFEVGGREHYLVNVGGDGLWDSLRAVADIERIVAEHQQFWGVIPYDRYYFMNLITESGGGLEHDNSCVLMASRWAMRRRDSYLNWLALVSHEFFHTWNVRRLRPRELMRYDYEREQYLSELWIAEGVTSYFDDLALVRCGLCTRDEYLQRLSKNISTVQSAPGRQVQSLKESSWDTWIKLYRPDENSQNSRISYYLKGLLVAWLLDVEIQRCTARMRNLDEVMRILWQEHLQTGYTLADFAAIVSRVAGRPMDDWLDQTVSTCDELSFESALEWFGLRFKTLQKDTNDKTGEVWIGSESAATEGRLWVRRVVRGSPSDAAGLNVDDELLALDGYRVDPASWPDRLGHYRPEDELTLTVARRGRILQLPIRLGYKPTVTWQLEVSPTASSVAEDNLRAWLRT
ncbi:MAG: M61 family metallopeptidase [Pirellulaceae bacterium]|nr:M61 family metallopeptidase [Pirellulaceae bacterium]